MALEKLGNPAFKLAGESRSPAVFLLFVLLFIIAGVPMIFASLTDEEIREMALALSQRRYALFGNAILTSDLRYELVSGNCSFFTLFAPPDSALFALDMVAPAGNYVQALRHHVALRHLSAMRLSSIGPGLELKTLANGSAISISQPTPALLLANSVRVAAPDMYVGPHIVVHGLEGILTPMPDSVNLNPDASSPRRLSSISSENTPTSWPSHPSVTGSQIQAHDQKSAPVLPEFQGKTHGDYSNSRSSSFPTACKALSPLEIDRKLISDIDAPARFCLESQTAAATSLMEETDERAYAFEEETGALDSIGIDADEQVL